MNRIIDISNIFCYGYFQKSDCDSVRCEVARLIPLLAQNNPYVQNIILETDLLPYLLTVLEEINASEVYLSYFILLSINLQFSILFLTEKDFNLQDLKI